PLSALNRGYRRFHDDGHVKRGFRHDARDECLSPREFWLRPAWDRSDDQVSALLTGSTGMFGIDGAARRAVFVPVRAVHALWSRRSTSTSFFLGTLAGVGFVLSFDIVWVHWIFGLHHLTNTQMDLVLEPLLVLLGLAFLWFAITQERRQRFGA